MTEEYQRGYSDGFKEGMTRSRLINWQSLTDSLEYLNSHLKQMAVRRATPQYWDGLEEEEFVNLSRLKETLTQLIK